MILGKKFTSIVLTVREDAKIAINALKTIESFAQANLQTYEIILVCNGPKIDTNILRTAIKQSPSTIHLLRLGTQESYETAALAGLDKAIGDFIFFVEEAKIDFQTKDLVSAAQKVSENFDVIFLTPQGGARELIERFFYAFFNCFFRSSTPLQPARVCLVSRRALNYALDFNHLIRFHRVLFLLSGFKFCSVPYLPQKLNQFESKTFRDKVSLAKDLLLYHTNLGREISLFMSISLALFSIGVAIYALHAYLFKQQVASGWTSLILFLSLVFTGLFGLLAILSEYLRKIVQSLHGRPHYSLESSESNRS